MEVMEMIAALKQFYAGKTVLLTGHTGFKGSWMLTWLQAMGAKVVGLALEPEHEEDLYNLISGRDLCDSHIMDIRDGDAVIGLIQKIQPDIVFHFAAQALVRSSYTIPVETFDINIMGTVHVLEGIRQLEKPCQAVMITTDKVYENMEREAAYAEDDRLGGFDPYSSSKAGAEIAIASYIKAFFPKDDLKRHQKALASARGGNVIGGGDWADFRLIPDLVKALSHEETLEIRHPEAIRPWQHVLELLKGYLLLAYRLSEDPEKYIGSYNFGPEAGDDMTVEELVKTAISAWGSGNYSYVPDPEKLHEAGILRLQIQKAKQELGWIPSWTSKQAVHETISWYRKYLSGENAAVLCLDQIQKYTDEEK